MVVETLERDGLCLALICTLVCLMSFVPTVKKSVAFPLWLYFNVDSLYNYSWNLLLWLQSSWSWPGYRSTGFPGSTYYINRITLAKSKPGWRLTIWPWQQLLHIYESDKVARVTWMPCISFAVDSTDAMLIVHLAGAGYRDTNRAHRGSIPRTLNLVLNQTP